MSIEPTNKTHENIIDNHNKMFNLKDIYDSHKDIIYEVYSRRYLYPPSKLDEMKKIFKGSLLSDADIKRILLGNYILNTEINKRPLAKLMQDMAEEANLFRYEYTFA